MTLKPQCCFQRISLFQFFFIVSNTHQPLNIQWVQTWIQCRGHHPTPNLASQGHVHLSMGPRGHFWYNGACEELPEDTTAGNASLSLTLEQKSTEILQPLQCARVHICLNACVLMAPYVLDFCPQLHKPNCLLDMSPWSLPSNSDSTQINLNLSSALSTHHKSFFHSWTHHAHEWCLCHTC